LIDGLRKQRAGKDDNWQTGLFQNKGHQQAVVLYTGSTTEIGDRNGSLRLTTGSDRFDDYCTEITQSGC
jgi:hypothetical protein